MFEQLAVDLVVPTATIGAPTGSWFDWVLTWCSMADAVDLWSADEILDRLDLLPPDDACAAVLRRFESEAVDYAQRVRILRLWERHAAWVAAQQQLWIVAVAGPVTHEDDAWVDEELGGVLHVSGASAAKRVAVARDLLRRFPRTLALLADGRITLWHAKALADKTRPLDGPAATFVEDSVLAKAASQTVGQFSTAVEKAVLTADMDAAEARAANGTPSSPPTGSCGRVRPVCATAFRSPISDRCSALPPTACSSGIALPISEGCTSCSAVRHPQRWTRTPTRPSEPGRRPTVGTPDASTTL